MAIDLTHFFLIREVHEKYLVHSNNEITIGFKMFHLPYGVTSTETQNAIFEYLNRIIRSCPEGTWFQKQDFFYNRIIEPDGSRHYSDISRENFKYYSMRYTMAHESFLYITYIPEAFRNYTLTDSQFVRLAKQAMKPLSEKRNNSEILTFVQSIEAELNKGTRGFEGKIMNVSDWEKVCYAYYTGEYGILANEASPEVLNLGYYNSTPEGYLQRENILFSNIYMGVEPLESVPLWNRYKVVSGEIREAWSYNPNEELENYAAFPITAGMPFPHVTTVTIQKANNQGVIKEINRQMKLNSYGGGGKKNPDTMDQEEKETIKGHAEKLKEYISRSSFPACTYGVTVTVPAESKEILSQKTEIVRSAFSQYAAKGEFNKAHNVPSFFSAAPGHGHNSHDLFLGQTVNAVPFININSYKNSATHGILYCDPTTGYPINFDPWDNPLLAGVRNGIYAGPTRGGKSVIVANECDYYYNNGFHQVLVEKGNSYEWLALIYGADYIELKPGATIGIDIFDYHPGYMSELQKSLLVSILSRMYPGRTDKVIAAVTNMVESFNVMLKQNGRQPDFEQFYAYVSEEYSKSQTVYVKHMDLDLYVSELHRYVYGANRWLFNNENSIKINAKPFVIFELKKLESSPLFNLAMEAILGLINRKMEYWDRAIKLVIKIDEALQPFKEKVSSDLLAEFYTQVGKFNASISIMVQSVGLVKELPAWEAANANTQLRIYTYNRHLDGWAESHRDLLNWTPYRYKLVKNLRSSDKHGRELLIVAGEEEIVVTLKLSPIANFAFSTTAEVRREIQKLKEENPHRGFKELIFEHYYKDKKKVIKEIPVS